MTKLVFMQKLNEALARLASEERQEILSDFEEHFANGMANGKAEEEVAKELGDPETLAEQYTEGLPAPRQPIRASGVAAGALASIALLLFDAIIAIPIIATLFSIWISLWAVTFSLFVAAFACIIAPFTVWLQLPTILAGVGVCMIGIALLALSVLGSIGMVYITKWSFKGLASYIKAHIRIIRGGTIA